MRSFKIALLSCRLAIKSKYSSSLKSINSLLFELEDIEFSKRFNVYSKDEIEGRYLITPAFVERFNNFTTTFGTDEAKCSFFEDKNKPVKETRKRRNNTFGQRGIVYEFSICTKIERTEFFRSMSRSGNCLDNVPIESFFGHLKDEMDYKIVNH